MRVTQLPSRVKLPAFKAVVLFLLLVAGLLGGSVLTQGDKATAAALSVCTPTGTTYGTDTMSVAIPAASTYHIWVRVQVPSVSSSSPLLLNMDNATGTNCYAVSGASITAANTWTWVDATAGLTTPTFTQANHTLVVTGTQSGAALDSIEFLSDPSCNPNNTDCATSTDTTPPTVSVTAPANGATVSGTTSLTATASDDSGTVSKVEFYDGTTLLGTDTTSPYTFSWNTTTVANGSHSITAKAYDPSNNIGTSSAVTVTVNNAPTCTSGTLAAPTGLTKTSSTYTTIGLSWTAPSPTSGCSITGYKVFRNGSQVGAPTTNSFPDTGLTAGSSNTYTVEAVDSGSNISSQSAGATFTTVVDNLAPNAPSSLTATPANASQVNLSWTGNGDLPNPGGVGIDGYNVYRCTGSTCTPNTANAPINGGTPVTGTSYSDTTVSASTAYNYVVTAVDNNGNESAPSNTDNATTPAPTCSGNPSQPGTPAAGTTTVTSVSFHWTASTASTGCTLNGYHVYQVNGSTYTLVSGATITGTTTLTATITGLTPNTSYVYAVEAFDTSGHTSDKTQTAAHITVPTLADTTAPTAPTSLTATATSSTQVSLSWPAASDNIAVTGYKIYRCVGSSCSNFTLLTTITGTTTLSYGDTNVAASTSYTYQVSALDGAGNESTKTNSNSVQTLAASGAAPSAPRSPTAPIVASQSANLTWTAPSTGSVTGYHVYINGVLDTSSKDTFTSTGGTLSCLAPAVTYTVTVKAFNSAGEGPAATVSVPTSSGGLAGDFNCDLTVNGFDLNALATNWLTTSMLPTGGDANGDTTINGFDLNALATNWGKSL
ncbi:MAG TPA: fibronectin type III domain-containing protein [Verrucomicrobiae bacterium]|nr:fibronectin type III domain-containing protein [Verrucomicrobiae bacterium]